MANHSKPGYGNMSEPTGDRIVFGSEEAKKIVENDKRLVQTIEDNGSAIEDQIQKIDNQEQYVEDLYGEIEELQWEHDQAENKLIDMRKELKELETGAMYG